MEKVIQQLEAMRRRYDKYREQSGSCADYLDLGRPNDEQKVYTEKKMAELHQQIRSETGRLQRKIRKTREECPKALILWKAIHLNVLDGIIKEEEKLGELRNTRLYLARELQKEWQNFPDENLGIPLENLHFLKDYRSRYTDSRKILLGK